MAGAPSEDLLHVYAEALAVTVRTAAVTRGVQVRPGWWAAAVARAVAAGVWDPSTGRPSAAWLRRQLAGGDGRGRDTGRVVDVLLRIMAGPDDTPASPA